MGFWRRTIFRYFCYGALFGACFPITATIFDLGLRDLPFSAGAIGFVQRTQPLHWMIDTAPLFLGLFAAFGGWRQERLEKVNAALGENNLRLAEATRRAAHAEELARLNAENARLYEQARQQLANLRQLNQDLAHADRTIRALRIPLIPVQREIMVLPLIGAFDRERVGDLRAIILKQVEIQRIRTVIVDCTGVEAIDRPAAHGLVKVIEALALLGAETLLTGISPATAELLADDGLNRQGLRTAADVASAMSIVQSRRR